MALARAPGMGGRRALRCLPGTVQVSRLQPGTVGPPLWWWFWTTLVDRGALGMFGDYRTARADRNPNRIHSQCRRCLSCRDSSPPRLIYLLWADLHPSRMRTTQLRTSCLKTSSLWFDLNETHTTDVRWSTRYAFVVIISVST